MSCLIKRSQLCNTGTYLQYSRGFILRADVLITSLRLVKKSEMNVCGLTKKYNFIRTLFEFFVYLTKLLGAGIAQSV